MVVSSGGSALHAGPHRNKSRPAAATLEDVAEEMINGMFCHYEPPDPRQRRRSILRKDKNNKRVTKTVRWSDGLPEAPTGALDHESPTSTPLEIRCNLTTHCVDAGVEAGLLPTHKRETATLLLPRCAYYNDHGSAGGQAATVPPRRQLPSAADSNKHLVFDDEGNPVSDVGVGEDEITLPPPPPPARNERFIPELCGIAINCVDDNAHMRELASRPLVRTESLSPSSASAARVRRHNKQHRPRQPFDYEDDDNSLVDDDEDDSTNRSSSTGNDTEQRDETDRKRRVSKPSPIPPKDAARIRRSLAPFRRELRRQGGGGRGGSGDDWDDNDDDNAVSEVSSISNHSANLLHRMFRGSKKGTEKNKAARGDHLVGPATIPETILGQSKSQSPHQHQQPPTPTTSRGRSRSPRRRLGWKKRVDGKTASNLHETSAPAAAADVDAIVMVRSSESDDEAATSTTQNAAGAAVRPIDTTLPLPPAVVKESVLAKAQKLLHSKSPKAGSDWDNTVPIAPTAQQQQQQKDNVEQTQQVQVPVTAVPPKSPSSSRGWLRGSNKSKNADKSGGLRTGGGGGALGRSKSPGRDGNSAREHNCDAASLNVAQNDDHMERQSFITSHRQEFEQPPPRMWPHQAMAPSQGPPPPPLPPQPGYYPPFHPAYFSAMLPPPPPEFATRDDMMERQSYITAHRQGMEGGGGDMSVTAAPPAALDTFDRQSFVTAHRQMFGDIAVPPFPPQTQAVPHPLPPVAPPMAPSNATETLDMGMAAMRLEENGDARPPPAANTTAPPATTAPTTSIFPSLFSSTTTVPKTAATTQQPSTAGATDEKELSWEERTKLAWDRIRGGFGFDDGNHEGNEKQVETAAQSNKNADALPSAPDRAPSPAPASALRPVGILRSPSDRRVRFGPDQQKIFHDDHNENRQAVNEPCDATEPVKADAERRSPSVPSQELRSSSSSSVADTPQFAPTFAPHPMTYQHMHMSPTKKTKKVFRGKKILSAIFGGSNVKNSGEKSTDNRRPLKSSPSPGGIYNQPTQSTDLSSVASFGSKSQQEWHGGAFVQSSPASAASSQFGYPYPQMFAYPTQQPQQLHGSTAAAPYPMFPYPYVMGPQGQPYLYPPYSFVPMQAPHQQQQQEPLMKVEHPAKEDEGCSLDGSSSILSSCVT